MIIISNNHNVYPKGLLETQTDFIIGACTSVSHYDPYLGHIYGLCSLLLPNLFIPPRLIVSKVRDLMIFNCALSLCNFFWRFLHFFLPHASKSLVKIVQSPTYVCIKMSLGIIFLIFFHHRSQRYSADISCSSWPTYHVVFFKLFDSLIGYSHRICSSITPEYLVSRKDYIVQLFYGWIGVPV